MELDLWILVGILVFIHIFLTSRKMKHLKLQIDALILGNAEVISHAIETAQNLKKGVWTVDQTVSKLDKDTLSYYSCKQHATSGVNAEIRERAKELL